MKDALAAKEVSFTLQLAQLQSIVVELKAEIQQQKEEIVALHQQIDERPTNWLPSKFEIFHPSSVDSNNMTAVAATGVPKSCADLRYMGHSASGLYLIMEMGKVETVYCDFSVLPSNPSKINFHISMLPIKNCEQLNKC